jgi:hypothetical protein
MVQGSNPCAGTIVLCAGTTAHEKGVSAEDEKARLKRSAQGRPDCIPPLLDNCR